MKRLSEICGEYMEDRFVRPQTPKQDRRLPEIRKLLDEGADATIPGLLIECCASRCLRAVQWMVKAGADVNQRGGGMYNKTPLMMCANAPKITRYLLKKGADVHARTNYGNTVLHEQLGLLYGHIASPESIQLLLDAGADIHARNKDGETPLIYAADRAPIDTIKVLLDAGADIAAKDNKDRTALDVNTWEKRDEILCAAWFEKFPAGRAHEIDESGKTMLMEAPGSFGVVKEYLKAGADPHKVDNTGMTALMHHAKAINNRTEILSMLIHEYKVDKDVSDNKGMTAILYAASEGYYYHGVKLLEWGCNPNTVDKTGSTIFHHLVKNSGWRILFPELVKIGVNCDQQDREGRTPLMKAILNEDFIFVQWLVEAGARKTGYKDKQGRSPQDYLNDYINEKGKDWHFEYKQMVQNYLTPES